MKVFRGSQAEYVIPGTAVFTNPGATSWTPSREDITSICVVCVGGGGGGIYPLNATNQSGSGGGALSYSNNIPVEYGVTYTVVVGAGGGLDGGDGGDSSFSHPINGAIVKAQGGRGAAYGLTHGGECPGGQALYGVGQVKYSGGIGGINSTNDAPGGAGAAGYSGNGGNGGGWGGPTPTAGSGGGGGGGGSELLTFPGTGAGGGGVGLFGQGSNGLAGVNRDNYPTRGGGGSGGSGASPEDGANGLIACGGFCGGGAGGAYYRFEQFQLPYGGRGGVRIMWGLGRAFPSTETGDY